MIRNPCAVCGRKPHCPEPCRPKEDYKNACKRARRKAKKMNRISPSSKSIAEACDELKNALIHEYREHRDSMYELTAEMSIRPCSFPEIIIKKEIIPCTIAEGEYN